MKTPTRTIRIALAVLAGLIIYAYGFQVTQVSLEKTREPRRQASFVRILRALAHPDIFEYEQTEVIINTPIMVGCPEGGYTPPEPNTDEPYMVITPACADPDTEVTVEGFHFLPNISGPINFIPPSGVTLQLGNFQTDEAGYFEETVTLPKRQPVPEPQTIRTITRTNVGTPHLSRNGLETWYKIIETVFLALLATTLGTFLAIPVSFLAARNIMKDITSPLASVALSILAWPIGIYLGVQASSWASSFNQILLADPIQRWGGLILSPILAIFLARWALPQVETSRPSTTTRIIRLLALLIAAMFGILAIFMIANLAIQAGNRLAIPLGPFGFFASFLANLGDIVTTILTGVIGLAVGGMLASWAGGFGQLLTERLPLGALKAVNLLLGAVSGASLFLMIAAVVEWLYVFNNPTVVFGIPGAVGAVAGLLLFARVKPRDSLPIGITIYYVVRTILNTLRSIEAFIMAIIFVVLVSTGPFAGVLALSLHTIAALAKLYSEQVESILTGPIEAVKATGATRLQTIVYAVIPQIVPPYISFTMYRWDINVRMSTIIGFAGGGGIGLLLQQNINLLNYRAASTQMIAITIVVAMMDYLSSYLRERVV
jgi:phosphonate ABC transporter permease subunit PhnE